MPTDVALAAAKACVWLKTSSGSPAGSSDTPRRGAQQGTPNAELGETPHPHPHPHPPPAPHLAPTAPSSGYPSPGHTVQAPQQGPKMQSSGSCSSVRYTSSGSSGSSEPGKKTKRLKNIPLARAEAVSSSSASSVIDSEEASDSVTDSDQRVSKNKAKKIFNRQLAWDPPGKDRVSGEDSSETSMSGADTSEGGPPKQSQSDTSGRLWELDLNQLEVIRATVRRFDNGELSSVGAANHPTDCKPCLFTFTPQGCQNSYLCLFCHFKHKCGPHRSRPCKAKRNRYRKIMGRADAESQATDEATDEQDQDQDVDEVSTGAVACTATYAEDLKVLIDL